jgi:hypothetical protein
MEFKSTQKTAAGRLAYDQDNHPPQHRPLHISFLKRERCEGKDLYNGSAPLLILKGGTLSVDDSLLDKPYSQYLALRRPLLTRASTSVP